MKVIIDDKIPFIHEVAEKLFGEVIFIPGTAISAADVRDADALVVRTRTRCDRHLLESSSVRFIVTATIGFDHLDTTYLEEKGIKWTNCPGCNASSVAQYIESSLLLLEKQGHFRLSGSTVGLIGLGHVGTKVACRLAEDGCRILASDPPRQEKEDGDFRSLDELATTCDVISFHTPLTTGTNHPTFHIADVAFFKKLKKKPIVINSARGGVVDEKALLTALDEGRISAAIVDTWENEPNISLELLHKVFLGTPHIAGYSADGKANATRMALTALCRFFHLKPDFRIAAPSISPNLKPSEDLTERKLQLYNPLRDYKALLAHPEDFEQLRGNYPLRRETWD